jgi:ferredoxin
MFFEDGIVEKIKCFTEQISKNAGNMQEVKSKPMFMGGLKKNVVAHIEITKYPKLHIDESKCTVCGICARHCPDNNLIHEKKLYFNT